MTASSVHRLREAVVWVGGTVLPELVTVAEEIASGSVAACGAQQRIHLRLLVNELTWGRATPEIFIREMGALCEPPLGPELVATRFLSALHAQPGMVALLSNLASHLPLRFVSDYPQPWLAKLAAGGGIDPLVDAEQAVYTADLAADGETWCHVLITAGVLTPGCSLWIDCSTRRAMIALRHGVDAALCADAVRLRRDLSLWRLQSPL